jgi:hypothetical protein
MRKTRYVLREKKDICCSVCEPRRKKGSYIFPYIKTTTLYHGGIRSHDPKLQSRRWHAEIIPPHHVRAKRE